MSTLSALLLLFTLPGSANSLHVVKEVLSTEVTRPVTASVSETTGNSTSTGNNGSSTTAPAKPKPSEPRRPAWPPPPELIA